MCQHCKEEGGGGVSEGERDIERLISQYSEQKR